MNSLGLETLYCGGEGVAFGIEGQLLYSLGLIEMEMEITERTFCHHVRERHYQLVSAKHFGRSVQHGRWHCTFTPTCTGPKLYQIAAEMHL